MIVFLSIDQYQLDLRALTIVPRWPEMEEVRVSRRNKISPGSRSARLEREKREEAGRSRNTMSKCPFIISRV
jgi:hypothetical protein